MADGHTDYHGENSFTVRMPAKYAPLVIANEAKGEEFKAELREHQQGNTDFMTFIMMCASLGIQRWEISMDRMTCTYYEIEGNAVLEELIPQ